MTEFVLDSFLPYQLAVASSRASRMFSALYRQKYDISVPEWRVVAHLSQAGAVSVREIHNRVDMDKSKVSRAASRLEVSGYVTKRVNKADRRLVELALTDKGRSMIDDIAPMAHAYEDDAMRSLGDDAGTFRALLKRFLDDTENCDRA